MNKIKLFSYIIMIEIVIVIFLLLVLVDSFYFNSSNRNKTIINGNELIYSEDKSIPFTGKMQDTINNKMIIEFDVVEGVRQGEFILLKIDGTFAVKGFMKKNKNDGNWKYYYDNGQLECTGNFDNDVPKGKWTWFHQNGLIKCEGVFINGKENGKWTKYNEDGKISMIIIYSSGEIINFIPIDKVAKV